MSRHSSQPHLQTQNRFSASGWHRIRELEGTEEDVENAQKAFMSTAGRGGMLEKLHEMGRLAVKVVRHQKTPTAAEESMVLKNGLMAEEWL